jgi:CheY-like chemotaxis protein
VTSASTGEIAIQLLENASIENPYQLVLMDWNLPKMDGITAARLIKNNLKIPHVPYIIMTTVYSREDIAPRLTDFHLDGYLTKPVHPSALFNAIVEAFDQNHVEESSDLQPSHLKTSSEKAYKIKGAKLLLVEDNSINQQVAKETLEQEGFDVTIAMDGQDAVQKIRTSCFDAILMDLQMPVMDGYEATRIIRSESQFDDLPIIAMTAHAMNDVRESCLYAGMNGFVTKPIDVDELLASLVSFIKPELRKASGSCLAKSTEQKQALLPEFLPGIDIQQGLKNVVGNRQLLHDLLLKFYENFNDAEARLDGFLQAGDIDSALQLLHRMKGVAANLGMPELKARIVVLEQALNIQLEYQPEILADFAHAQNEVLQAVKQLRSSNDQEIAATMNE